MLNLDRHRGIYLTFTDRLRGIISIDDRHRGIMLNLDRHRGIIFNFY